MGLKDVVERLAGRKSNKQLGSRRAPERKRRRDEDTVQVPSPIAGPPRDTHGSSVAPPVRSPAPTEATPRPAASPPPAPAPAPQPAAAPPRPAAPPPRSRADSAEATQYVTVPGIVDEALVGVLVGIGGKLRGEIYKVFDRDMKVGRAEDCDVKLLDERVSREHARIVAVDADLMIVPLSDKNPVFVNEQPVDEAEQLSDGDKLQLGNPGSSVFRFRTIEGT